MKHSFRIVIAFVMMSLTSMVAQDNDPIIENIIREANENSQLEYLAHNLIDVIGPRLVGTPEMKNAHDWVANQYKAWGIASRNEQWGEWRGWQRGITHIDMMHPRLRTLTGMQLAWSPSTSKKGVTGELITLPQVASQQAFQDWLLNVKGKLVLVSMNDITGRPDYNWKEFATEESFAKMKEEKEIYRNNWNINLSKTGYSNFYEVARLTEAGIRRLEEAGAIGIVTSRWSMGFGANKVFDASTKTIPTVMLNLEDYSMLYRMVEYGDKPVIRIVAESKELGTVPTFNTIAEIKGTEKPEEYVILSAHLDSWDGATGATDNGTGTILMMEAMRLLKKFYPNPKRTILAGHWGGEEQGTNGSKAFVEDHPELVKNIQVVFNQDNGTGRIAKISGAGFLHSYDFLSRWLSEVPIEIAKHIETEFPGSPVRRGRGSSDNKSFLTAGVVTFNLEALDWSYRNYTWHTNLDTYDKIVFDDVRSNVILTAILTFMASEDSNKASSEKAVLPINPATGKRDIWPEPDKSNRNGGID